MADFVCTRYNTHPVAVGLNDQKCLFGKRTCVYKCGLVLAVVSFILFLFGDVGIYSITSGSSSFIAKICFFICLAFYIVSTFVAFYGNARKVNPHFYHSRNFEISLIITGVICLVGIIVMRAVFTVPNDFILFLMISVLSLVCLFIGTVLVFCGNVKPFSGPIDQSVLFTPVPAHHVSTSSNYGMHVMTSNQCAVQGQPLLPLSAPHQGGGAASPPPYFFPPMYPAPYMTQVVPGYSYLPTPTQYSQPSAPLQEVQDYPLSTAPGLTSYVRVLPSAPHEDGDN